MPCSDQNSLSYYNCQFLQSLFTNRLRRLVPWSTFFNCYREVQLAAGVNMKTSVAIVWTACPAICMLVVDCQVVHAPRRGCVSHIAADMPTGNESSSILPLNHFQARSYTHRSTRCVNTCQGRFDVASNPLKLSQACHLLSRS
jgi:hypothetical protein